MENRMNPVLIALFREFQADLEHGMDAIRAYHPAWPGLSRPPINAGARRVRWAGATANPARSVCMGGRDKPGYDDQK